jgi:hypothetical protein
VPGGGFVKSCIDDGHIAVGLEGSDFSKKRKRAEWAHLQEFLFTCDVTRPFQLSSKVGDRGVENLGFDVVTSWEFIEHIKEDDIAAVADNVLRHLVPGGIWILSIANFEDVVNGVRLHQTVRPNVWWRHRFEELGFVPLPDFVHYFRGQFVRGARKDNERSFHLVLTNDASVSPKAPCVESIQHRVFDLWNGSTGQLYLRKLIGI